MTSFYSLDTLKHGIQHYTEFLRGCASTDIQQKPYTMTEGPRQKERVTEIDGSILGTNRIGWKIKSYLVEGTGKPWAWQGNVNEDPAFFLECTPSSIENTGALDPTGSLE